MSATNTRVPSRGYAQVSLATFLFCLLLFSQLSAVALAATPAAQTSTTPKQPVTLSQSLILRRDAYEGFEVDSFSTNTTVYYIASTSAPISVALMTGAQYDSWQNDLTDPISNSITYTNGTSIQNSAPLPPGQYFIVFYAYLTRTAVDFGFQVYPSTPYSYGPISPPLAPGIASFGVSNSTSAVSSYEVKTSEVVGTAKISAFQVNTPDAFRYNTRTSGSTIQLNTMLIVNDSATTQKVYWVQNVPDFVTTGSQVAMGDEVWNNTDTQGFLSNQTITSTNFANGGFVYQSGTGRFSSGPNLYAYSMNNLTYRLPVNIALLVRASVLPKTGVLVQAGYRFMQNGSAAAAVTHWFDNVTIHDPTAQAAYFDVNGNASTPTGHYYDAEMVFAGEGNLATAHFLQLNATFGLFYQNAKGLLASFPTYYGFSGDTGEAADDVQVTFSNGLAQLAAGPSPNYAYLGSASSSLDPNSLLASSGPTGGATGQTTTSVSTSASGTNTQGSSTGSSSTSTQPLDQSTRSTNSSASAPLSNYVIVFAVGAAVGIVFALVGLALVRRRPASAPPAYEYPNVTTPDSPGVVSSERF